MNKARSAVLATLTLSVLNLCFVILSVLTKTRVFPDYPPMVIILFTVFLITLAVLSIWQLFAGLDGQVMRGKILLLLALEYFLVYVADLANIFPRSAESMGQTLFAMEMLGAVLAVLLFISANGYIKSAPIQ